VLGNGAAGGDLQCDGLRVGRVVRRVAQCAHCRRVRREDEAVLPARDISLDGGVGERDVRETREECNPSFQ
jgi:hypothetical protein